MNNFKLFFETRNLTAVIAYGRYNPPTIGHEKLIKKVREVAQSSSSPGFIIPSHTVDSKKNPLNLEEKIKILQAVASDINVADFGSTFIGALQELQKYGYENIKHIAGSDRIPDFKKLIDTYNGRPDKSGAVPFSFKTYEFISAGERDPDSEGVEGMSASKLRDLAKQGDYENFIKGMPTAISKDAQKEIFNIIRERIK